MTKFPILAMLNHAEQIIIDSLKKSRRNANFMSTYMFSDIGNTMEDEFCRSGAPFMSTRRILSVLGPRWRKSNMAAMK